MNWHLLPKASPDFLKQPSDYSSIVAQLFYNRGINRPEQIEKFFNPDYEKDLHNPFLMKDMEIAVERIGRAIKNKEKITVFGDYDADGVTATVVLTETLKMLLGDELTKDNLIEVYIPDRAREGYGLNKNAVEKIAKDGTKLIITVDCGMSDQQEIELAKNLGLDVMITDHHWPHKNLPKSLAILNPRINEDTYPFKELAGVGVAFKLVQALLKNSKLPVNTNLVVRNSNHLVVRNSNHLVVRNSNHLVVRNSNHKEAFQKWLLDLVAIGTIADRVPLIDENRVLAKYGLIVLAKTKRVGLRSLIKKAGLSFNNNNKAINSHAVGFMIAPRLNAAGRMDHANTAYELLTTELPQKAEELAQKLEEKNRARQNLTEQIINQIKERLKKKVPQMVIFETDQDWPVGILGLVAGKLVDEFGKPAIICHCQKAQDKIIGSGRSIDVFNLIEAIGECSEFLIEFGGHSQAAGFSTTKKNLKDFADKLEKIAQSRLKNQDLGPTTIIEVEIKDKDIDWDLIDKIEKLAPFGEANEEPIFLWQNAEIKNIRTVGNDGKHLVLALKQTNEQTNSRDSPMVVPTLTNHNSYRAIGFGLGNSGNSSLKIGDKIDIVFSLEKDKWNGEEKIQLKIIDYRII